MDSYVALVFNGPDLRSLAMSIISFDWRAGEHVSLSDRARHLLQSVDPNIATSVMNIIHQLELGQSVAAVAPPPAQQPEEQQPALINGDPHVQDQPAGVFQWINPAAKQGLRVLNGTMKVNLIVQLAREITDRDPTLRLSNSDRVLFSQTLKPVLQCFENHCGGDSSVFVLVWGDDEENWRHSKFPCSGLGDTCAADEI